MFKFHESWTTWEMHPHGSEIVICISGLLVLHQERADGTVGTVTLAHGQYAINAPGVWHTADISVEATGVFITAGMGTEVRPR
jgi:quercetin dioxygenase-like cupin family protein